MLPEGATSLAELRARFAWRVAEQYSIAEDVCGKWARAEPEREALVEIDAEGARRVWSHGALWAASGLRAAAMAARGVGRGDRVAILLPQSAEALLAHLAAYRLGAIALPLFTLFGPDALAYRLRHAGARLCVTDRAGAATLAGLREGLPELAHVLTVDGSTEGAEALAGALAGVAGPPLEIAVAAEDPALLIYTSGTTGAPKGVLHAHRVLLGHLPGVEMSHGLFPQAGDRIWTPADWAWIGGLLDVLMPALHHGVPVVARRFRKFTAEAAYGLMAAEGVRNVFLPPSAIEVMRAVAPPPGLGLRSVASGGEPLGPERLAWGRRALGAPIDEFYGQTECNMVLSHCAALEPPRPGVTGFAVPGHDVAVIDADGAVLPEGVEGEIAVRRPDPVMFLGYWRDPEATARKFRGDWLLTGDRGVLVEAETRAIRFVGRDDDVITSAGYRIGPGEIEDCLAAHPAVRRVGVIGKPDAARTEIVCAFVELADGVAASEALAAELAAHVKARLAAHAYPREIRFVDALPVTATGKIMRGALRALVASEPAA